jgi:dsDNA-specific endonuclease/ATPase MutS2
LSAESSGKEGALTFTVATCQHLARNQLVKSFASAALNGGDGVTIVTVAA